MQITKTRTSTLFAITFALLAAISTPTWSQAWPTKPVRMIVPYAPGGGADIAARHVAQKLSEIWGQSVVVDNRAGAQGNIGTVAAARAAPDGYTIMLNTSSTVTTNPSLYDKIPFDPVKDFVPIAFVSPTLYALVVPASSPYHTVQDLIAAGRTREKGITLISAGVGSNGHLAGELFRQVTGTRVLHVPYKSSGPAISDLIGGTGDFMFADTLASKPHVASGKLRALGLSSKTRSSAMPDLKPIAELGVPGFDVSGWTALFVPADVPAPLVQKIRADAIKALDSADLREKLVLTGQEYPDRSPQHMTAVIRNEIEMWRKVVTTGGIRAE